MQISVSTDRVLMIMFSAPENKTGDQGSFMGEQLYASSGLTPSSSIPGYTSKHLQHFVAEPSYGSSH